MNESPINKANAGANPDPAANPVPVTNPTIAPARPWKKQLKSDVNRSSLAVLLDIAIMNIIVIVGLIIRMAIAMTQEMLRTGGEVTELDDATINKMMESGIEYLISASLGLLFIWLIMRKKAPVRSLFEERNVMTPTAFFCCFFVFMGIQLPASLLDMLVETILNNFGLTASAGMEAATAGSKTISMFIYASIVAPVVEELIYRGFIMNALKKYGKVFAIVISSILFGLMHCNLIQSIFAMTVGLILGYVAMNYSIKWSILLHFINNCIFGEMMVLVTKNMPTSKVDLLNTVMFALFTALAITVLVVKKEKFKAFIRENACPKEHYKFAFTSVAFIITILIFVAMGLLVISPM